MTMRVTLQPRPSLRATLAPRASMTARTLPGTRGAAGADGSRWYNGLIAPSVGEGVDGDYYLNTTTGEIYRKADGAWSVSSTMLPGYLPLIGGTLTGDLTISYAGEAALRLVGDTQSSTWMTATAAAVDSKIGRLKYQDGAFWFRNYTDALGLKNTPLILHADASATFGGDVRIDKASPLVRLHDSAGTANARQFGVFAEAGLTGFVAYNDAGVWQRNLLHLAHGGGLTSYGNVTVTGNVNTIIDIEGSSAAIVRMKDTGAGANLKYSAIVCDGGSTVFRHLNDDLSTKTTPMYFGAAGWVMMPNYAYVGEGGGSGYLRFQSGYSAGAGWIGWYNSSGNRLAYVGDSNTNLLMALENGAEFQVTGGPIRLPGWSTAGRPSPQYGQIGWNTDTNQIEHYRASAWHTVMTTLGTGLRWNDVASGTAVVDLVAPSGARGVRIKGVWSPSTAGQFLCMHTSGNGGSSYDNGAGNYSWGYFERIGAALGGGAHAANTYCRVGTTVQGADLCPFEIVVTFSDGGGSYSSFWAKAMGWNGTNTCEWISSGFRNSGTPINAVRLLSSSGNISDMRYTVEYF